MMKKIKKIFIYLLIVISCFGLAGCRKKIEVDLTDFELVWEDEFNGSRFNETKWHYDYIPEEGKTGVVRKGGFWINDAVNVMDSNLIITTDYREKGELGAGWYSGAISTAPRGYGKGEFEGNFSQKYGYFEIKCKVPAIYGSWSAFWMMPINNFSEDYNGEGLDTGENGAEIDIFESPFYYDKNYRYTINHAVHYDGYRENLKTAPKIGVKVKNLYDEWHIYGLEWNQNEYKFFVDGVCTWIVKNDKYLNSKGKTVNQNCVAQVEEYLLLSNEVVSPDGSGQSAGWCGNPDDNDKSKKYDFVIDYIRVYQYK